MRLTAASAPAKLRRFPGWTQRVMRILKDQFVPQEYAAILTGDGSVFAEGIAVARAAKAPDLAQSRQSSGGRFAQKLAERLALDRGARAGAVQVEAGAFTTSVEFPAQVMQRLFAPDFGARRALVAGLAVGNRLPELLDGRARRSTTDATAIDRLWWFYWPEAARLKSVREVAWAREPFFAENRKPAGAHGEERIRKLANRPGLSFKAKQARGRKPAGSA